MKTPSLGYIQDKKDSRDFKFSAVMHKIEVPPVVDYEPLMSPVKDQGHRGMCVAFATCAVKEYQEGLNRSPQKRDIDLSEEWIYRYIAQSGGGAFIRDAVKLLTKTGVPRESLLPYNEYEDDINAPYTISNQWLRKNRRALGNAKMAKAQGYTRLHNIEDIMQSLATNGPAILGIRWYSGWNGKGRRVYGGYPVFGMKDVRKNIGGHAVCIVGYDKARRVFKIKNSWGTKYFGKKGYAYLEFDALGKHFDCWATFDMGSPMVKDAFKLTFALKKLGKYLPSIG